MKFNIKNVETALDECKSASVLKMEGKPDKVRKFDETIDMIINIRGIDLNNPKNRIDQEFLLPHPIDGNMAKVCFVVKGDMEMELKSKGYTILNDQDLDEINHQNNKQRKKLVKQYDYFVARGDLMINVAKVLARFLGQQGKMPKPSPKGFSIISPNQNLDEYLPRLPRIIRIAMKKTPIIQIKVGKKSQSQEDVLENINSVLTFIDGQLEYGIKGNVKNMYIKTTMGPSIKIPEE